MVETLNFEFIELLFTDSVDFCKVLINGCLCLEPNSLFCQNVCELSVWASDHSPLKHSDKRHHRSDESAQSKPDSLFLSFHSDSSAFGLWASAGTMKSVPAQKTRRIYPRGDLRWEGGGFSWNKGDVRVAHFPSTSEEEQRRGLELWVVLQRKTRRTRIIRV